MKEFFKTTKGKSLFKLWLWLIFVLIVYIVLTLMPDATNENADDAIIHKNENIVELKKDYSYNYKITINEENIQINGIVKNGEETGYKETKDGIIKYEKKDNDFYQINMDEQEIILDFYGNLEKTFLDYDLLYPILNNLNCSDNICHNTYNDYELTIDKSITNSLKVTLTKLNENYELTYNYE